MARYRDTLIPGLLWAAIYVGIFLFGQWIADNGGMLTILGWIVSIVALAMGGMTIQHTWRRLRMTSAQKQTTNMMRGAIGGQMSASDQSAGEQNLEEGDLDVISMDRFMQETLGGRPNQMSMGPYEGHSFQCACGESHTYHSDTVPVLRELPGSKLVFVCPNDEAITCVQLKGMIRFKGFESLFGAYTEDDAV